MPQKLQQQVAILDSQPGAGMVYGTPQYWHSWTGDQKDAQRDFMPGIAVQPRTLIKPPELLILSYPLGAGPSPCPSDLLFRSQVAMRTGGFEESYTGKYQLYEDQAFLAKVYLKESVYVAGECWDKYRIHPESCVANITKAGQYHSVRLYYLNWLTEYLTQQGVEDVEVWKAVRKALWPYRHPILNRLSRFKGRLVNNDVLIPMARRIIPRVIRAKLRDYLWRITYPRRGSRMPGSGRPSGGS